MTIRNTGEAFASVFSITDVSIVQAPTRAAPIYNEVAPILRDPLNALIAVEVEKGSQLC